MLLQASARDIPEWMKYSTVHPSGDLAQDPASTSQLTEPVKTDTQLSPPLPGKSCDCAFYVIWCKQEHID